MPNSKELKKSLTKQKVLPYVGAIKELMIHSGFYLSMVNFFLIAATAYNTTLVPYLQRWFPWMTFPAFVGILIGIALGLMITEYKFVLPSYYAFRGKQYYQHESDVAATLETLSKKIDELQKKLEDKNGKGD